MAQLVKHFRLVHDTAPFVLFPFFPVPNVEERPVQRPATRVNPNSLNRRNPLPSLITFAVLPGNDKRLACVGPTHRRAFSGCLRPHGVRSAPCCRTLFAAER